MYKDIKSEIGEWVHRVYKDPKEWGYLAKINLKRLINKPVIVLPLEELSEHPSPPTDPYLDPICNCCH